MSLETEYWEPESLVAKLVVGAKVRIRFGECPWLNRSNELHGKDTVGNICHDERFQGQTGIILNTAVNYQSGHHFEVTFLNPVEGDRRGHYAAIELEPVEEEQ